jgi:hypothetical protein
MRAAVYWPIKPAKALDEVLAQVDYVARLTAEFGSKTAPDCRVVGIKFICDGVVDGRNASLKEPYSIQNTASSDPIWSEEQLHPPISRLRCMPLAAEPLPWLLTYWSETRMSWTTEHRASRASLCGGCTTPGRTRHHRQHPASVLRLRDFASLASTIGKDRCKGAIGYCEFADGVAPPALGSDAPTAPHPTLANCSVATTRLMMGVAEGVRLRWPIVGVGNCESRRHG